MWTLILMNILLVELSETMDRTGPVFFEEPPNIQNGAVVECRALGEPKPIITWKCNNHSLKNNSFDEFRNEIMVRSDGALILTPLSLQTYRLEVESWIKCQCIATNKFGSIASREVRVNTALLQPMDIRVNDEFVVEGNVAVLKCLIQNLMPNFATDIVWHLSDGLIIKANETKGKYTAYTSGELHIRSVDENDLHKTYRCKARNRLTTQMTMSPNGARLILSDSSKALPPRIIHHKSEIIAEESDWVVMIPCGAEANPLPIRYSWHKTSKFGTISSIEMSERVLILDGTLIMSRISASDSGRYLAIVSNSIGEERCVSDLLVRSKLKVIIYPNDILQMTRGQSFNMTCRASGYPIDQLYWTHDLKRISSVSNTNDSSVYIDIELLEEKHIGMYQCFASNSFESVQATVQLSISDESPRIVKTFEEKIVNAGTSLSISCTATGSPLAQIEWTVDGHALPNLIRYRSGDYVTSDNKVVSYVNITSVRIEDGGRYRCLASNLMGQTHYENRINVYGPPAIKSANNLTVLSGTTVQMYCPYYGYPISSIDWMNKDGRTLPLDGRQIALPNGTLIIKNVNKKSDEGLYECVIDLSAKTHFYLKVMVGPRIDPFNFPEDLEEGMRLVVICAVLAGDSPISINWLKDGHPLTDDLKVEMVNEFTSSITFNCLRTKHSGQYTCIANNNVAQTNYSSVLTVNMAPVWVKEPKDVETVAGKLVVIDCQAEGLPEPQIRWKRMEMIENKLNNNLIENLDKNKNKNDKLDNYKTITSNAHIQILENGSLIIRDVNKSDERKYICSAFNGVNSGISRIIKINVKSPPNFEEKFKSISVRKKEEISLECDPYGDDGEAIEIEWKKNSIGINSNSGRYDLETKSKPNISSKLIISSAERLDSAIFTCIAINRFGSAEKNFRLLVLEVPDPPFDLKSNTITSNSVTITWSEPYNGNALINQYIIEYKVAQNKFWTNSLNAHQIMTSHTSHEIKNLIPITSYEIRVRATNLLGKGEFSQFITITTLEEPPSLPPTGITIMAISARSLKVWWKKPIVSSGYEPIIKGYYVGYRIHASEKSFVFKTVDASLETDREEYEINNLIKFTKYDIRVQAFNSAGSGPASHDVIGQTLEFDVPNAPVIRVLTTTSDSIELEWSVFGDEPISGFIISYRGEDKEWKVLKTSTIKRLTLNGLKCGSRYQIYMNALNAVGQGDSSDVIICRTEGSAPLAPDKSSFVKSNQTSVVLNLNSWKSIGCKIDEFIVQYKRQLDRDWRKVEYNYANDLENIVISNLMSGQWYNLLITASSQAGNTDAEYLVSTLTYWGSTIAPIIAQTNQQFGDNLLSFRNSAKWLLSQLNFVIPISCAVIIVILVTIVICVLHLKDNTNRDILTISVEECVAKEENHINIRDESLNKSQNSIDQSLAQISSNQSFNRIDRNCLPKAYATSILPPITRTDQFNPQSEDCVQQTFKSKRNHVYDVPFISNKTINDVHYQYINKSMDKLSQLDNIKLSKQSFGCGNSQENIFF